MKRSEINAIIKKFEGMLREYKFEIPDFLKFTPEEWQTKGHEYDEIRDNALGWDITDFGHGDYYKEGLALMAPGPDRVTSPTGWPERLTAFVT